MLQVHIGTIHQWMREALKLITYIVANYNIIFSINVLDEGTKLLKCEYAKITIEIK